MRTEPHVVVLGLMVRGIKMAILLKLMKLLMVPNGGSIMRLLIHNAVRLERGGTRVHGLLGLTHAKMVSYLQLLGAAAQGQ